MHVLIDDINWRGSFGMNTSPNALELFESSVKESLFMFFCLFVCQLVWLFVFGFCFFLLLFFCNRKEEEWHIATRGELWHLKSKLRDFIVLGRVNLIRSDQWPTIDQSIEVHYCSFWFKQTRLAFNVLGLVWFSTEMPSCMQREATTLNHRKVLAKICVENWQKSSRMKTASDSPVDQHLFIYLYIFAWKLTSTFFIMLSNI